MKNWAAVTTIGGAIFGIAMFFFWAKSVRMDWLLDSNVSIEKKVSAVAKISDQQKSQIEVRLVQVLPGDWDAVTYHSIIILGEIGSDLSFKKISEMLHLAYNDQSIEIPGKIVVSMNESLAKIDKQGAQKIREKYNLLRNSGN